MRALVEQLARLAAEGVTNGSAHLMRAVRLPLPRVLVLLYPFLMTDLQAELEWRLARALVDRRERAANEARIAELDKLIAQAQAPSSPSPPPPAESLAPLGLVGLLALFAVVLLAMF